MPQTTTQKPRFNSKQDALNFLNPTAPRFANKLEAMRFLTGEAESISPQVAQPDTQQVAEPSSQGFSFNVPDFLKQTIPPRSPGSSFAAPVSTAVQPRITSPEDFLVGQNLPQQQVQAREGPIEVPREERREQFAQRAADVITRDIGSLIQGQVPKTPENKSILSLKKNFSDMSIGEKVLLALAPPTILTKFELADAPPSELVERVGTKLDVFGKAVIHGVYPLIANKIPIAKKERENLEEKFPITFMAGEFVGATVPIISSFKATEFALKPIILSLAKSLAESSKAKQFGTKLGLKLTKGALAGSLFEVLSGRKPTPETAAFFALFEAAIPGSQKAFDVAIKDVLKAKTKAELQAVTNKLNKELTSLRSITGKSQLKSLEQRVKGRKELQKAKVEIEIIDAVIAGRKELRKAKEALDKLTEATVLTKEGKNVTARVQNILENLKKEKELRQSTTGGELLNQALKLEESLGNLQRKALPKTEVIQRKGKPPVVTGEKSPKAEARTQAEIESFGKLNKFLTAEQKIDPANVGILDKAISDFADGKIRQFELIAKFNDAIVKKIIVPKIVVDDAKIAILDKSGKIVTGRPEEHHSQIHERLFVEERTNIKPGIDDASAITGWEYKGKFISIKDLEKTKGDFQKAFQNKFDKRDGVTVKPVEQVVKKAEKAPEKPPVIEKQALETKPFEEIPQIAAVKLLSGKVIKGKAHGDIKLKNLEANDPRAEIGFSIDNIFVGVKNIEKAGGDIKKAFEKIKPKPKEVPHGETKKTGQQAVPEVAGIPVKEGKLPLEKRTELLEKAGLKEEAKKLKQPKPTQVEGGKPQENLALGVQATVPPGKIKTVQGEKTGLFAQKTPKEKQADIFDADLEKQIVDLPGGKAKIIGSNRKFDSHEQALKALSRRTEAVIRKGTKIKVGIEAEDPLDEVIGNIKLRKEDRLPDGSLKEEIRDLQSAHRNRKVFTTDENAEGLDEWATKFNMTESELIDKLINLKSPTVRVRKTKEDQAFFLENKKAGIEAEKEFKKAGEPHINEKGELVSGNKVLFQASGGMAGLETDDEGNPTFNANKSLAGLLATSVGVNVLRSHRVRRLGTVLIEKIQNSQIRVRKLQELRSVKLIGKGLDPYETEIRYHGRIDNRLRGVKKIAEEIDKGIAKVEKNFAKNFPAFQDRDFQQDTFLYLISKHAPEYNAALGKRAAGMTTREAEKTLIKLRNLPYFGEIKRTASQIKKLSDATLDILADGQIISKKVRDDLRKRWPEYISFQRILENVDNTQLMQILSGGKGISVVGTGLKRAKGSQLEISDVLTNTVANVEQAFVRAEKNIVALSTLEFARNNPQLGLFRELKFGKVKDAKRVEQPTLPLKNVLPFESIPVVDVSAITGKPIFNTQKLFRDKNILGIRENGKQVFLRILDPSLAAAFRMTGQKELGALSRAVGAFTRYVTATATRFNPAFQVPNLLRDTQEMAVFLTAQKEFGISGAVKTSKGIIPTGFGEQKTMTDIWDAIVRGKDTPGARLYKQMQADGGTTGGLSLSTRKNLEINITKIRKANRSHPRKVLKEVVKFFDNYNALFEDATRLSVYKESLVRGLTRKEAAVLAKEATINFNRKGTIGAHMNAWYAFANASVQGSTKMIRAMRNPKTAAAVTSAVFAGTIAQNKWNDMIDPDWRDKVPQWERNNNLVILMPGAKTGRFERMLIPVSWGIKPIKTLADYFVDLGQGHNRGSKLDIVTGIVGSALDAYNPVGGSNLRQALVPTILDVPNDIAANMKWYGAPIKNENPFKQNLPESDKYFRSTGDTKFGQFLINATGYLNDNTNGVVSVSPEVIKYTIEQYAGGTGRFAVRSFDTVTKIGSGKAQDINEIPVVRRFFKSTPEDVIKRWQEAKKLNDPSFKRVEQQAAHQEFQNDIWVRDAFEQLKKSKSKQEKRQIVRDLINKNPKAYKKLLKRLNDDKKGISYFDSAIKDLPPNFRAGRVMIEIEKAKDKKARLAELTKAKVINTETAFHMKRLGFKKPE